MLVDIRRNFQKAAAVAIIGLLVLAFASWGIADYVTGFTQVKVASINGSVITDQAYAQARQLQEQRYRASLGDNYQPGTLDDPTIKMTLVQELVDDFLRVDDAKSNGYRVSPQRLTKTITEIDAFHDEQGFDRELYQQILNRQGFSISRFEADLAQSIITEQIRTGLSKSSVIADPELDLLLRLQGEQRDIRFQLITRDDQLDKLEVSDQAIQDFYNEHIDRFQTPELVRIEYLELVLDDYADRETLDDEALAELYEEQQADFQQPEKRRASHLLISVVADADDDEVDAALTKVDGLRRQLIEGADFGELAKENSDDLGSAKKAGDLGLFGKDVMDPAFETAAFALPLNQISDPVRSAFGYHLIKVTEIQQQQTQPLAEVSAEISLRHRRQQAESAFFADMDELQDSTDEQPDSLQPAADQFGLEIQQSALFPRYGGAGITATKEVIDQAFSDDVLLEQLNSQLINIEDSRAVVLRVVEHQLPTARPLTEVRQPILEVLKEQLAADTTKQMGEALLEQLNNQTETSNSDTSGEWQDRLKITRTQAGLPPPLLEALFRMASPSDSPVHEGLALDNGDYIVYAVTKLHDQPLTATDEERLQLQRNMERLRGDIALIGYLKGLRSEADIKIYPENL
ncbi:MAG: SurA N-terminal domain-containing protein [Immundisolibacteraceae bacterium]|nr:SurA N-terminal domain-containing protein [Immundisolibacteraceae bacterium]